jgi:hypothetical protein
MQVRQPAGSAQSSAGRLACWHRCGGRNKAWHLASTIPAERWETASRVSWGQVFDEPVCGMLGTSAM